MPTRRKVAIKDRLRLSRHLPRTSDPGRIVTILGAGLGVVIAVMTVLAMTGLRVQALHTTLDRAQATASLLADQAEGSFEAVDLELGDIIASLKQRGLDSEAEFRSQMSDRAMNVELRARASSLSQIDVLAVVAADGQLLNFSRFWPVPDLNVADRDYAAAVRANPTIGTFTSVPVMSRISGTWAVYLARRVNGADQAYLGAVTGAIELAYFQRVYQRALIQPFTAITLTRQDGTLLVRTPRAPGASDRPDGPELSPPESQDLRATLALLLATLNPDARLVARQSLWRYPIAITVETTAEAALAQWTFDARVRGIGVLVLECLLALATVMLRRQVRVQLRITKALSVIAASERRQAEAAASLAAVTAAMPGVLIRRQAQPGGQMHTSYVSPTVRDITGYTTAEATAPGWPLPAVSPADADRSLACERQALQDGGASTELAFRHRDGRLLRFHAVMRRNHLPHGTVEVLTVWTDVTRERELAQELDTSARIAQLGEVVTGMAHELNQPLAIISMAAENAQREMVRRGEPWPRLQQRLDVITTMVGRAAGIIDHMRVFGRTGTGPSRPVALSGLLETVATMAQSRLSDADADLRIALPPDLPPVLGKIGPLEQVFYNLIVNACDAFDADWRIDDQVDRFITVSASVLAGTVVVSVRDNAGGIAQEAIGNLFQPFFTTRGDQKRVGLGLSVSYGIITELNGSISAANDPTGAVFRITLPAEHTDIHLAQTPHPAACP